MRISCLHIQTLQVHIRFLEYVLEVGKKDGCHFQKVTSQGCALELRSKLQSSFEKA